MHANVVNVSMSLQAAAAFNYALFSCANSAHSSKSQPAGSRTRTRTHTRLAHRTFLRSFLNAKEAEFDSAVGLEHSCTPSTWIQPNLLNLGYCSLRLYLRNKHWLSFHNRKLVSVVAEIIPTHLLNFHIIFLFCLSNKL